jgi:hypothetical protein
VAANIREKLCYVWDQMALHDADAEDDDDDDDGTPLCKKQHGK